MLLLAPLRPNVAPPIAELRAAPHGAETREGDVLSCLVGFGNEPAHREVIKEPDDGRAPTSRRPPPWSDRATDNTRAPDRFRQTFAKHSSTSFLLAAELQIEGHWCFQTRDRPEKSTPGYLLEPRLPSPPMQHDRLRQVLDVSVAPVAAREYFATSANDCRAQFPEVNFPQDKAAPALEVRRRSPRPSSRASRPGSSGPPAPGGFPWRRDSRSRANRSTGRWLIETSAAAVSQRRKLPPLYRAESLDSPTTPVAEPRRQA